LIREEDLEWLPGPYEVVEFQPNRPFVFRPVGWKIGKMVIMPKWPGAPPKKEIVAVRVFVTEDQKKTFPYYWDITPSRLVAQLASLLTRGVPEGYTIKIVRDIPGPSAHFTVELVPV